MTKSGIHQPTENAVMLREKIPVPLLIITLLGMPPILYVFFGGLYVGRYDLSVIALFGGILPWAFIYKNNTGLKLAWTNQRIYMRPQSFRPPSWRKPWLARLPWRSLGYSEIARIDGLTVNDPGAASFLLPFQLLKLSATGATDEYDERHIWLYSLALRDKELAPLLHQLDVKCPGLLPAVVRKRLALWEDRNASAM